MSTNTCTGGQAPGRSQRAPLKDIVESLLDGAPREQRPDAHVSTRDLQRLAERGGSFDFWQDDRQDVYSLDEGEPIE